MLLHEDNQLVQQLEKRRGGYNYLVLPKVVVTTFPHGRTTRVICQINNKIEYRCGLNHLGDGNFFIIVSGQILLDLGVRLGESVSFSIVLDPDQLGVDVPESLSVLLDIDPQIKARYEVLSMGKKRHVIHAMNRIKNIDKQIAKAVALIEQHSQ